MKFQKLLKSTSTLTLIALLGVNTTTFISAQEITEELMIDNSVEVTSVEENSQATETIEEVESTESTIETYVNEPLPGELVGKWSATGDMFELKSQSFVYGLPAEEYKITEYTVEKLSDTVSRYTLTWDVDAYKEDYDKTDEEVNPQPFVFEYASDSQELTLGSMAANDIVYTKVSDFKPMTEEEARKYISENDLVNITRSNLEAFDKDVQPAIEKMTDEEMTDVLLEQFTTVAGLGDFGTTEDIVRDKYPTYLAGNISAETTVEDTSVSEETTVVGTETTATSSETTATSSETSANDMAGKAAGEYNRASWKKTMLESTLMTDAEFEKFTDQEYIDAIQWFYDNTQGGDPGMVYNRLKELHPERFGVTTSVEVTKNQPLKVNQIKAGSKTISGTVTPNSTVLVFFAKTGDKAVVNADANGNWSVQVPSTTELKEGDIINVTATLPDSTTESKQVKVVGGLQAILPQTGEQSNVWVIIGGILLVVAAIGLMLSKKKDKGNKDSK